MPLEIEKKNQFFFQLFYFRNPYFFICASFQKMFNFRWSIPLRDFFFVCTACTGKNEHKSLVKLKHQIMSRALSILLSYSKQENNNYFLYFNKKMIFLNTVYPFYSENNATDLFQDIKCFTKFPKK